MVTMSIVDPRAHAERKTPFQHVLLHMLHMYSMHRLCLHVCTYMYMYVVSLKVFPAVIYGTLHVYNITANDGSQCSHHTRIQKRGTFRGG